jgi:hypothetical protein
MRKPSSNRINGRALSAVPAICERKLDMTVLNDAGNIPATNVGALKRRSRSTRQMIFESCARISANSQFSDSKRNPSRNKNCYCALAAVRRARESAPVETQSSWIAGFARDGSTHADPLSGCHMATGERSTVQRPASSGLPHRSHSRAAGRTGRKRMLIPSRAASGAYEGPGGRGREHIDP